MFLDYMFTNRKWKFWKEGPEVPLFLNKRFYHFPMTPSVQLYDYALSHQPRRRKQKGDAATKANTCSSRLVFVKGNLIVLMA